VAESKYGFPPFRSLIRFDVFELDANNCQLRRNGLPVDLSPQTLKVLTTLAERPDQLVTREEIKASLWPGQFYGDFDSRLNFAVKKLRETLGDNAERPRYIQTVRNAGYRFIAPIQELGPISSVISDQLAARQNELRPEPPPATLPAHNGFSRGANTFLLALVIVSVLAVAAMATFMLKHVGLSRSAGSEVPTSPAVTRPELAPEIATVSPILPQSRQRIVIRGRGFGSHVPYSHTDSPYLAIRDKTAHWAAGRIIPWNWDEVMLDVDSWTDGQIVLSGFSGSYGERGWKLNPGDDLEIVVWNPQSGAGSVAHDAKVNSATATR
jgi:DNA-binding winged helix-turn-helix (wHTH) protein